MVVKMPIILKIMRTCSQDISDCLLFYFMEIRWCVEITSRLQMWYKILAVKW